MGVTVTVRQLDDETKARLRMQAAKHGRSMEAEAREILRSALAQSADGEGAGLIDSIRRRFNALGGAELQLPERETAKMRRVDLG